MNRGYAFTSSPHFLQPSVLVPLIVKQEKITISDKKLKQRVERHQEDPRVEPLYMKLKNNAFFLKIKSQQLAKPLHYSQLFVHLSDFMFDKHKKLQNNVTTKVPLTPPILPWINLREYSKRYATTHQHLIIDSTQLNRQAGASNELMKQVKPYLKSQIFSKVRRDIAQGRHISVDMDLLPTFAKKMVKRYLIYQGPNCFHASMAFQDMNLVRSKMINVKKEKGYHRSMINYDELWRILQHTFHEVEPSVSDIQYGDVIVFFDPPKGFNHKEVNFRWIKHTTTYLFSGYTFSKGSKSANSPYTVKKFTSEWAMWKNFGKNLHLKVFRRSLKHVNKRLPKALVDWLY